MTGLRGDGIFFTIANLINKIRRLNYRHVAPDVLLIALSLYISLWMRVGGDPELLSHVKVLNKYIALFIAIRLATFIAVGVYDVIWRFISLKDSLKLGRGILFSSVLLISATYIIDIGRLPRSIFFIDASLSLVLLAGDRKSVV